ncbi:hypothetical protein [Bacillus sp. 03113]|uniref:hypothetical protein n=1 Tax=Bacillus sp. 03113 TaxID=2578211 RepID=UPI0011442989|nr:hypothetical protein [Bacillus sp. 03113]
MVKVMMLVSMAAETWSLVPGNVTEVTEEVATSWINAGLAKSYEQQEVKVVEIKPEKNDSAIEINLEKNEIDILEGLNHVGGGWYLLPNGEKVQGKEEALAELAKLGEE